MLKGAITAVITPFDDNDLIDIKSFAAIIDWQIKMGINGLCVCGSTGEAATIAEEEYKEIINASVNISNKTTPVIVGVGSNSTRKAIRNAEIAQDLGANYLLAVVPYYNKPSQLGIYEHFKTLANAVDIPVILYNIPNRSIVNMSDDVIAKLAEIPNIVGLKDSTGDMGRPVSLQAKLDNKNFAMLSGDDSSSVAFNACGGVGAISVIANLLPDLVIKMHEYCNQGDFDNARKIWSKIHNLDMLLYVDANPMPIKYAMSVLGLCNGKLRLPLTEISDENKIKIKQELKNFYDC
jgi:4-hydroxy-tetrahydrodipicolinate synthase